MSVRLTKRVVDSVEPAEKDQFLWDGVVKGFGLKVTPTGGRIYVLQYRFAAKLRRYTIGKHGCRQSSGFRVGGIRRGWAG